MPGRTVWSRLEPRPRSPDDADMKDALRAPVRDPLWMLSRQWQVSEFRGEDGGSPVRVDLSIAEDDLKEVDLQGGGRGDDGPSAPFDYEGGPLEAIVEREEVMTDNDGPPLRLRAEAGKQFRRTLADAGYGEYTPAEFPAELRLAEPDESLDTADRRYVDLMADRVLDGTAVARAIRSAVDNIDAVVAGETDSWSGVSGSALPLPEGGSRSALFEDCVEDFYRWYVDLYDEPTTETGSAWNPSRLEYQFAVSTGQGETETVFEVPAYKGGHLDWYAFSSSHGAGLDSATDPPGSDSGQQGTDNTGSPGGQAGTDVSPSTDDSGSTSGASPSADATGVEAVQPGQYPDEHPTSVRRRTVMPSPISFPGMPASRWWEFEDSSVNLAASTPDGVGLPQLLLVEFATQYGNNWYQIPVETPVGTCTRIPDLQVTDSFGVTETAEPASDGNGSTACDAPLFMHDLPGQSEPGLFLPPTLADSQTGEPVEKVVFARDEMANMAFAIERNVESPTGQRLDRTEFQQPRVEIDRVSADEDPDAEFLELANPGEDRLVLDGYTVQAEMDDATREVHDLEQLTLGPGESVTVYTGQPSGEEDRGAGLSTSVWSSADAVQITNEADTLVAKKLLARPSDALADYRLSTDVPPYWFPFTVADGEDRRLERALLLDAESLGLPFESIPRPLGEILRPESKRLPPGEDTYRVYGEEVTRSGREVTRRYQYARWTDGASHLWSSRESRIDDTQLDSDLAFDVLEERS